MRRLGSRYVRAVYWFTRPPYWRYGAALLLVAFGLYAEFRPQRSVPHPFAVVDIDAGAILDDSQFEMRQITGDHLEPVTVAGWASHPIAAGDPLLPSAIDPEPARIPDGWWALQVSLPPAAEPGSAVRLVVRPTDPNQPATTVPGIVIAASAGAVDPLGLDAPTGLVAVPERDAARAATAVADRRITVLVSP